MPRLRWRRLLAFFAAVVLLALLLPFLLSINRFHRQIRQTLESEFGRRVSLGGISLRLLPRLGLDAEYVTVEEDPAFGAEPFIRAEKLACDINPWALWRGRVEFSRLAFTRPSINLVKNATGRWNLGAFLEQAGRRSSAGGAPAAAKATPTFTSLWLDEGRINFKVKEEKKVYGLVDTDARLDRGSGGRWKLWVEGTPFRTDRALTEAGSLRLEGELGPLKGGYGELPLAIDMRVEKAQLADLLVLFLGRETGVLGRVEARARFTGTPHEVRVEGTAKLSDIHRWDLLAPPGAPQWQLRYRLGIDARLGRVQLEELAGETSASRFRATGSFMPWSTPKEWELHFAPLQVGLTDLWGAFAAFRKGADPAASLAGTASGALTWLGPEQRLEGSLEGQAVALKTKVLATGLQAAPFRLDFTRQAVTLKSLSLFFRPMVRPAIAGETLELSVSWHRRRAASPLHLRLAARSLRVERLRALARALGLEITGSAELEGAASFAVDYQGQLFPEAKFARRGWAELRGGRLVAPWLNGPIAVTRARLEFAGNRVQIAPLAVELAGATISGNLIVTTEPALSCLFNLEAGELDADRLDQLLNPGRRGRLPLGVALERSSPPGAFAPAAEGYDFFVQWRARGQVNVARLLLRGLALGNLRAEANYNARHARLDKLRFDFLGGRFSGEAQLDFVNPPGYRLAGQLDRIDLGRLLEAAGQRPPRYAGILSARGQLETTGPGMRQILDNLAGRGAFIVEDGKIARFHLLTALSRAAGLTLPAAADLATEVPSLSGEFFVASKRVRLANALLVVEGATAAVEGTADLAGRLNLALRAEPLLLAGTARPPAWPAEVFANRYRLVGTLREPEVRLAEARERR